MGMSRWFIAGHTQTSSNSSLFLRNTAPLSSGRIVSRVKIAEGNFIHPTWATFNNLLPVISGLPRPTLGQCSDTALVFPALIRELHLAPLLNGGTRGSHWQSAWRLSPDTWRLGLPLDDCCRLVLPYHAVSCSTSCNIRNISQWLLLMGTNSSTTINHPSTPCHKWLWA